MIRHVKELITHEQEKKLSRNESETEECIIFKFQAAKTAQRENKTKQKKSLSYA